ncbi:Uncharacterised protein [Legionella wadsworthii]|uniref:Uncharacterized protein n=1 Tax=Legionella wadsworthii TaxID=28088 RepID=A0A378LY39_9GAMM|nr:hypothetical protein [Legionella wadsworthii]STY31659.1 Uncharacterised protein [Legionella wadsworthii]
MYTKLFNQKSESKEEKEKKIQFVSNLYAAVSHMSHGEKQRILIGALMVTDLTAKEVVEYRVTKGL